MTLIQTFLYAIEQTLRMQCENMYHTCLLGVSTAATLFLLTAICL